MRRRRRRRPSLVEEAPPEMPLTPAHARFGAEGVLRLRARHAEILARISERVEDAVRRDELKSQAERLNPDTWVTDDEVRAGIDEYEAVLGALRAIVGQGRRRPRSGAMPPAGSEAGGAGPPRTLPGAGHDAHHHQRADGSPQPDEEPV